jgi:hypothetical protein
MPQAPQCITLVAVEVSQPLLGSLSQSPKLPVHMPTAQRPIAHDGAALAGAHTAPQAPQWSVLAAVSTQPPLQHARPAAQGWASLQPGTHSLPRQRVPGAQWLSAVQATQRRVVVSQRGIAAPASAPDAAQAMSSRQPAVQRRAIGSQYSPVGQRSLVGVHATQRPVAVSQAVRPSSLPAQSLSLRQRDGPVSAGTSTPVSRGPASKPTSIATSMAGASTPRSVVPPSSGPPTTELPEHPRSTTAPHTTRHEESRMGTTVSPRAAIVKRRSGGPAR